MSTIENKLKERFFRYVKIDTQSNPNSDSIPSTEKQKDLSKVLVEELHQIGIVNAHMDTFGYVYATIPSNSNKKNIPSIMFCSHVDTSPDCSGFNVKPIIHKNYDGKDIILPDDTSIIIKQSEHPDLADQLENDIITASGLTLLGADNKAGLAEIMTAVEVLINDDTKKHGDIKILFTPDEEIGRGTLKVDIEKLGADFGYTVDGESLGTLENETFSADAAEIKIFGVSAHPGFAKGKLVNAIKIAAEILEQLPKNALSPETTEGREGFIHATEIIGGQEECTIKFIIRDFEAVGLVEKEELLNNICKEVLTNYPAATYKLTIHEQYRNMAEVVNKFPQLTENAIEAMKRVGLQPKLRSIRGGTDGSRLSFMGIPCPNIFAGEHAFHSKQEWVSLQDMVKATEVIVALAEIWEEKS